jgi:hypothetical protein
MSRKYVKVVITINQSEKMTEEMLLRFNKYIKEMFDKDEKDRLIRYVVYQHEISGTMRRHIQMYLQLKKDKTIIGIKKLLTYNEYFDHNKEMHVEEVNGSFDDCKDYCRKDYNRCKECKCDSYDKEKGHEKKCRDHGIRCKCDFFNINHRCDICVEYDCGIRTTAKWDLKVNNGEIVSWVEGEEEIGPFEYGKPVKHKAKKKKEKYGFRLDMELDKETQKKMNDRLITEKYNNSLKIENIMNGEISHNEILKNTDNQPTQWYNTYNSYEKLKQAIEKQKRDELPLWKKSRWWKPVVFYLYGASGAGKTGLVNRLFMDEMYIKPTKIKNSKSFWDGYVGQEIVLLDEFYTRVDWGEMLSCMNDVPFDVEYKGKGFSPFLAKYIFITNSVSPKDAFKFDDYTMEDGSMIKNKKTLKQFLRRIDYVIRFEGDYECKTTRMIFERYEDYIDENDHRWGTEQEFRLMNWDVKYNKGFLNEKELISYIKELNEGKQGEVMVKDGEVYWKRDFGDKKREYLRIYPNFNNNINPNNDIIISSDSSSSDSDNDSSKRSYSSVNSDDSDDTRRKKIKKGKQEKIEKKKSQPKPRKRKCDINDDEEESDYEFFTSRKKRMGEGSDISFEEINESLHDMFGYTEILKKGVVLKDVKLVKKDLDRYWKDSIYSHDDLGPWIYKMEKWEKELIKKVIL